MVAVGMFFNRQYFPCDYVFYRIAHFDNLFDLETDGNQFVAQFRRRYIYVHKFF